MPVTPIEQFVSKRELETIGIPMEHCASWEYHGILPIYQLV